MHILIGTTVVAFNFDMEYKNQHLRVKLGIAMILLLLAGIAHAQDCDDDDRSFLRGCQPNTTACPSSISFFLEAVSNDNVVVDFGTN